MTNVFQPTTVNKAQLQRDKEKWISLVSQEKTIYLFAYGSLMWKPDCNVVKTQLGTLEKYHRDFCLYSYMYRGTVNNLGLVLGLKSGGSCVGLVLELCCETLRNSLSDIWDREMITGAYVPIVVDITCADGTIKKCHTFIARTQHNQWAGDLTVVEQVNLIYRAVGTYGNNKEYLYSTYTHMLDMGIDDPYLKTLVQKTKELEQ